MTVAKIGLRAVASFNAGCAELPCWVQLGHDLGDLSPLDSAEFAALVERHERGGFDAAHVAEDWMRDKGLEAVADGWRAFLGGAGG